MFLKMSYSSSYTQWSAGTVSWLIEYYICTSHLVIALLFLHSRRALLTTPVLFLLFLFRLVLVLGLVEYKRSLERFFVFTQAKSYLTTYSTSGTTATQSIWLGPTNDAKELDAGIMEKSVQCCWSQFALSLTWKSGNFRSKVEFYQQKKTIFCLSQLSRKNKRIFFTCWVCSIPNNILAQEVGKMRFFFLESSEPFRQGGEWIPI